MTRRTATWALIGLLAAGCATNDQAPLGGSTEAIEPQPASFVVWVAGEPRPIETKTVTFRDPGGYDAYLETCHFDPSQVLPKRPSAGCDTVKRYRARPGGEDGMSPTEIRERIHQFVLHYDVCITSRRCFEVLHDLRGLSVHFMLDLDGTLYQTLDLAERARHAGFANDASIGIEIAHPGAFPPGNESWRKYYRDDADGRRVIDPPAKLGPPEGGPFVLARQEDFRGVINGSPYVMADFTEGQYRALEALVDFLCREFPRLRREAPRAADGTISPDFLGRDAGESFEGILGHWHVSERKQDPGPAMDWDRILRTSPLHGGISGSSASPANSP
ncbi:MAG: N-acetylmuramoyl-L-alanine amidase [Planctomycetes bacterium]|nr:N-acetylmuramoyl-L-alanine amidase [Planctomycetota bacterium]